MSWDYSRTSATNYGMFGIVAVHHLYTVKDLTFFRGVPTTIEQFTYADPFSDATAVLRFPQITGFDNFNNEGDDDLYWMRAFNNVNIYWWEASTEEWWPGEQLVRNPDTGQLDLYLHIKMHPDTPIGEQNTHLPDPFVRNAIWEGYFTSFNIDERGLSVECQGSLFQLDRFYAMPYYPYTPSPVERYIKEQFDRKPLHTWPLVTQFPDGWTKLVTAEDQNTDQSVFKALDLVIGEKWTGTLSRYTGAWEPALTGYVQSLLAIMYTDDDCGVEPGDQWTVLKHPNLRRTPLLKVRERNRPADFYVWFGQPGASIRLAQDGMQLANVVFGKGRGLDGTDWMRQQITAERTDWEPLWFDTDPNTSLPYWPYTTQFLQNRMWPVEKFQQFPPGVSEGDAIEIAKQWIKRDGTIGWNGEITLQVDPIDADGNPYQKWNIRPGQVIKVKGFSPYPLPDHSAENGWNFHIAEVTCTPNNATVVLRVDTKFRDLLTLEEVQQRTRDPLTPVKALRVNSRSVLQDDLLYPWAYENGAGAIPKFSVNFHRQRDKNAFFPYDTETTKAEFAPSHFFKNGARGTPKEEYQLGDDNDYPNQCWYVPVNAGAVDSKNRWSFFPILTAQAGEIRRTELCAYDWDGNRAKVTFHFSIYSFPLGPKGWKAMPNHNGDGEYDPFLENAFQTIDPTTGLEFPGNEAQWNMPDLIRGQLLIGWGSVDGRAGYSPYIEGPGVVPTGMLEDEGSWSFNNVSPQAHKLSPSRKPRESQVLLGGAIYCDDTAVGDWVYFMGRIYKKVPGVE